MLDNQPTSSRLSHLTDFRSLAILHIMQHHARQAEAVGQLSTAPGLAELDSAPVLLHANHLHVIQHVIVLGAGARQGEGCEVIESGRCIHERPDAAQCQVRLWE